MRSLTDLLGGHPFGGGAVTVAAAISFLAWEYLRLKQGSRLLPYAPLVRRAAVVALVLSAIVMGCRFLAVA